VTPQEFIAKWQRANLTERSACQQHFLDLCDLLGQAKPAEASLSMEGIERDGPKELLGCLIYKLYVARKIDDAESSH
jgi:hypothetical protein